MSSIKKHWRVFQEEMKRRSWPKIINHGWAVFAAFGGTALVFWYPLSYVFPQSPAAAKLISVIVAVCTFLLLMLRFWETYHDRILSEVAKEWQRVDIVDSLQDVRGEGTRLIDQCHDRDQYPDRHPNLERLLNNYHQVAAKRLDAIGSKYKRYFYEEPVTEKHVPELPKDPGQWEQWTRDRNNKLLEIIQEFKKVPSQLLPQDKAAGNFSYSRFDEGIETLVRQGADQDASH